MAVNVLLGVVTVAYPVAVYLGLEYVGPRYLALGLLGLVALRVCTARAPQEILELVLPLTMAMLAISVVVSDSDDLLLFYPVLVNAALLLVFAASLRRPPSIVERLARLREPNLTESGVAYTRKVTLAWCLFFSVNAAIAAWTATAGNLRIWTLYNGLVSYLLIGVFFVAELIIRRFVRRRDPHGEADV